MAINFPDSPTIGDEFTGGGFTWTWSGSSWEKLAENSAVASNDFVLDVGSSSNTTYVLDKTYPSGSYKIAFANGDSVYDIYAISDTGTFAGYTNTDRIIVTSEFSELSILGANTEERITFLYEGVATSPTSAGDKITAGAYIDSISDSTLTNIDDSTIISGGNFANNVTVTFTGTDLVAKNAKSVVRSSSTSIIAVRPDDMPASASPYTITVTNPGIDVPSASNRHILSNSVTAGGTPVWTTLAGLPGYAVNSPYTTTLVATDVDGSVSYSLVSGSLPSGFALDATTGVISGTTSDSVNTTFTIRATDLGGNYLDKVFSLGLKPVVSGGTLYSDSEYYYHKFTSSGTLSIANSTLACETLVVAGGGAGGWAASQYTAGGGGGAGGYRVGSFESGLAPGSYSVVVGAGATASSSASSGSNSSFSTITSNGGGAGAGNSAGSSGGSGGGGSYYNVSGYSGISGQGNRGGNAAQADGGVTGGGGGGGGAGAAGANGLYTNSGIGGSGGSGSNAQSSWATATSSGVGGYYAGGGGGAGYSGNGAGGAGGGGAGQYNGGISGTINTGGGGGGSNGSNNGGNGGSGIVIVRYLKAMVE